MSKVTDKINNITKEQLYDLYIIQKISIYKIGKLYNISDCIIGCLLDKYKIRKIQYKKNITKQQILKEVNKKLTMLQTANNLNIGVDKLRRLLLKYDIKTISNYLCQNKYNISKKQFEKIYYETNLNNKEIYKKLNISYGYYFLLLKKYNIDKTKRGYIYFENNKEKIQKKLEWKIKNKEYTHKYMRTHWTYEYHNNPEYKFKEYIRNAIRERIKNSKGKKFGKTEQILGCTIKELRKHLENQFKPNMSWDNYGTKGWHIDHIKPCCKFDLSKEEEQCKCFNYKNLQPLWWYENLSKGGKYNEQSGICTSNRGTA